MRPSLLRLAKPPPSPPITTTPRPKTTRLANKSPPPSLEQFIQRQRVISLYRSIVRSIYKIPADRRSEPLAYTREEFGRHRDVTDVGKVRYLISVGKTEFDTMQRYIEGLAGR